MATMQLVRLRKVDEVTYMVFSPYRKNNGKSMFSVKLKSLHKTLNGVNFKRKTLKNVFVYHYRM